MMEQRTERTTTASAARCGGLLAEQSSGADATSLRSCLAAAAGAAHRQRYCDTRSRVSLLDENKRRCDLAWCGATCYRTVGASLATARYQARGKAQHCEWHMV